MILLFILFAVVVSFFILLIGYISKEKLFGQLVGHFWMVIVAIILIGVITKFFTDQKVLTKKNYYGTYIINRDLFKGKQSDWQYNHFRFEIKENDSIYFYKTNKEKILKTYYGVIETTALDRYESPRLIIKMDKATHHILTSNPTTYRSAWSFYLVFKSPLYQNVYFKKGKWNSLD